MMLVSHYGGGLPSAVDPYGGLLDLYNGPTSTQNDYLFGVVRGDGSGNFNIRGGNTPRWLFSLDGRNINAAPTGLGILDFQGAWPANASSDPILYFQYPGPSAELIRSVELNTDTASRFEIWVDGRMKWGSGNSAVDTNLYRSSAKTLQTDGNLTVAGNLDVMGQKAALVPTSSYGPREVYAIESPEEWFEDFGSGRLHIRSSVIYLDPIFDQTVNTTSEYHVFLTPNGRCTLYVTNKTSRSFTVKLLSGDLGCSFDYRITAKRKGYEKTRLAAMVTKR